MVSNIFVNLAMVFIVASILGFLARALKQPKIPFYVLAGLLIGPFGYNLAQKYGLITFFSNKFTLDITALFIQNPGVISFLEELGIALLLFVAGLELNLKKLKEIGKVATIGGTIQVFVIFVAGFALSLALGFVLVESLYIAAILAFSSTIVVVKLLVDRNEISSLHGRIILGFLLIQDFFAVLMLSFLSSIGEFSLTLIGMGFLKIFILVGIAILAGKFIFPGIFRVSAKSNELLLLSALSICFIFSLFALGFGFSIAIGAFIAGITLANLPYNIEIIGRMNSLRNFFVILFFVSLGLKFFININGAFMGSFLILLAFVILFKPFIIWLIVTLFNYTKSVSFFSSISLAQISEFSLIIILYGSELGHISKSTYSMILLLAVVTMSISSYFIEYKGELYSFVSPLFFRLHHKNSKNKQYEYLPKQKKYKAILIGVNRVGSSIINSLKKLKKNVLIIDYNPEVIKYFINKRQPCLYGDIGNLETISRINFEEAEIVISTVPIFKYNKSLFEKIKKYKEDKKSKLRIILTADKIEHALNLYELGADYVILPHLLGGEYVSLLMHDLNKNKMILSTVRKEHIKQLRLRRGRLDYAN